jgi:phage terminase small subunit
LKKSQATRKAPQGPATPAKAGQLSAEAAALERQLAEEYGISDRGGEAILRVACEAFDRLRSAQAAIVVDGLTSRDRFGQVRAHPLLAVERDARSQMLAALKQLNLDVAPLHPHAGRPAGGS